MVFTTADILADKTNIHPALENVFNYRYPTTLVDATALEVVPVLPITFYDRHIDSSLTLKSVKSLGFFLARYLCELCDDELEAFVRKEGPLRAGECFMSPRRYGDHLTDAFGVARYYALNLAYLTPCFPSKFYFHPS
ncbi:hypothetical protein M413DRAFT_28110 [Hebeloma cylindrosporum]|uniref:Uncharacterized protein n=1 Tax=Hebeloma cylindrosporum TaxID=76867 RepID=A0A0C2XTK5_HEBCY|nr:hypothetical protein M413DRAFT_28110 [Hebeloma cylindrosporum h7]